jgi:hypothetical protein
MHRLDSNVAHEGVHGVRTDRNAALRCTNAQLVADTYIDDVPTPVELSVDPATDFQVTVARPNRNV